MTEVKKRRRVLFLFAHLHKGGMQRAASNISMALPDDFEQFVGFFGTENPPFEYHATLHNFKVPGSLDLGLIAKFKNVLLRIYKLRKFVRKLQIDAVVSFGNAANILNAISLNSAYRILSIRGAIGDYGENKLYELAYRAIMRWVWRFSDVIIAVSDDLKKEIVNVMCGKVPVRHIPNLYHLNKIREQAAEPLPENLSYLEDTPFILNIGSLVYQKGVDLLIKAFADIKKIHPDLLLVLIGRGHDKEKYISEADRLGIGSSIKIFDFDPNPYRYMGRATVFVLPSRTEGFPNVLVEAMACGCPVVAFDCPTGPREILGGSEYGELVENMTAKELAIRLNKLLSSDERLAHLKIQAERRADSYDAQRIINRWVNILSGH